jgi:hypothetical protein
MSSTRWRLRVMDLKHHVKVDATIRFSKAAADESCMAGHWKRVIVEAKTAYDEKFFPIAGLLAYEIADGRLSLGQTGICDDYLSLSGILGGSRVKGRYNAVGPGIGTQLGYFTLTKAE